ncbi:circadian clock KaiB family protein [Thioalkalivibrio sp. AKL19]|uniref:circadian clock KaiB family protein n=1 Tax=Thioalkalivibrio sp. AKL19 TaxID=1266914 RepID=UPI0004A4CF98|nr:circadian clock KaiB family protein [Thioalkalivibrio sp. AKL19]
MLLRLYIAGFTPGARRAIENMEAIVADLSGAPDQPKIDLEVIDVLENPQLAEDERILATPLLIRRLPVPIRRLVGDLSDRERVLIGLDLRDG